ncbi:uncharacterized protein LOC143224072 [Tachypleus tridentatus]|uniref:uncharacterized protein LOC143224072 n=1 Tax=Tachypleus tridentatus TaxID=6853 RepID=UPI003FD06050
MTKCEDSFEGLVDLIIPEQFMITCYTDMSLLLKDRASKDAGEIIKLAEQYMEAHGRSVPILKPKDQRIVGHNDLVTFSVPAIQPILLILKPIQFEPSGTDLHPFPPPPPPFIEELPPLESAWERGLRHAKELMKRANYRKEQEPDFEEKRLNLSLDINDRFLDYDKENDFYGRSPPRKHGDEVMHYGEYGNMAGNFKPLEREARDFWRGRYENFEIHWSRPEFEHRGPRDKERPKNYRYPYDREKASHLSPEEERWKHNRNNEDNLPRTRGDEWRDPWRR